MLANLPFIDTHPLRTKKLCTFAQVAAESGLEDAAKQRV